MAAVALAAAALLPACGGEPGGSAATTQTTPEASSNEPPPGERRCPGGPAAPINIAEVISAAAAHGIELLDDPTCADRQAVAQAANILQYGPNANRDREDEIMPKQGDVTCFVTAEGTGRKVERMHYDGDAETSLRLANLECIIYPDEEHEQEQLAQLEATMENLAKKL